MAFWKPPCLLTDQIDGGGMRRWRLAEKKVAD